MALFTLKGLPNIRTKCQSPNSSNFRQDVVIDSADIMVCRLPVSQPKDSPRIKAGTNMMPKPTAIPGDNRSGLMRIPPPSALGSFIDDVTLLCSFSLKKSMLIFFTW